MEAPTGSVLLIRCGSGWRLEGEAVVELRYPPNFFDRLLFSQLADCRMLYEFFSLPAPEEEFLCYDYPLNSPPNHAVLWLCEEFLHPDQHSEKLLHCMMTQALTLLHRDFRTHLAVSRSTMIRGHEFGKVLKYMGDHYDTVTLTSLAQEFNYNPSYLSTLFRQVTGETFRDKLFHIRMEQGLWALEHTDQSVQQISRSLGFKEKSYFLRQFKARYGATPSRYRKTLREQAVI